MTRADALAEAVATVVVFCIVLFMVTTVWVGLEYIIEGAVHSSIVDTILAHAWSWRTTIRGRNNARRSRERGRD